MSFDIKGVMSFAVTLEHFIGYVLIIYGVLKIVICIIKTIPEKHRHKWFPFIKKDSTHAGVVLDFVLFSFGIFAVLRGLSLAKHLHPSHAEVITSIHTITYMYMLFGLFLLFFYTLVLYTNLPISKDPNERSTYEILGLGAGLTYLISLCLMLAWNAYTNNIKLKLISHSQKHNIMLLVLTALILGYMNLMLIFNVIKEKEKNDALKKTIFDVIFLPLGAVI